MSVVVWMEDDDISNDPHVVQRVQQPLVLLPEGDIETAQIERAFQPPRAGLAGADAVPERCVGGRGAGEDGESGTGLHRVRVVVHVPEIAARLCQDGEWWRWSEGVGVGLTTSGRASS